MKKINLHIFERTQSHRVLAVLVLGLTLFTAKVWSDDGTLFVIGETGLTGHDWSADAWDDRSFPVTFNNVEAGTYKFKIRCNGRDNCWSSSDCWGTASGSVSKGSMDGENMQIVVSRKSDITFTLTGDGWQFNAYGNPHYFIKYHWGDKENWTWSARLTNNGDGTFSCIGSYRSTATSFDFGWAASDSYKDKNSSNITVQGTTPTTGDKCQFTFDPSTETLYIRKCNSVTPTNYIYFDNSEASWTPTNKYFVIGHNEYSTMYGSMSVVANTKLWYGNNSSDSWSDCSYYAIAGGGSTWDEKHDWGPSSLSGWDVYSAPYQSNFNLLSGCNYIVGKENGNNDAAITMTAKGNVASALNSTQAIKYSVSRDGGSTYAELNSGVTPAQITISAYKFVDGTYNTVTNTSNSNSVSANQSSTYTTSVPAAYTGATSVSYTSKRDGYTFIGWYNAASGGSTVASPYYPKAAGTVYARFKAHRYNIKFDANDTQYPGTASGSTTQISNVVYDQNQTLTANGFSRVGYTFAGWATTAAGSVAYTDEESVSNLSSTDGDDVTLYAKWTVNPYRVDVASVDHVTISATSPSIAEGANANANYGSTVTLSYSGVEAGYAFGNWIVYKTGDESTTVPVSSNQFTMPDYAVTVSASLYTNLIAWCEPDIDITGDIHLTSTKDVYVQDVTSLLTISSDDLGSATSLEISYLDGSDDAVEAASSLFRLCADGTSSYAEVDYSPIDVSASREYAENYSIKYTPNAYEQLDNGKVVITAKKGDYTLKSVTKEVNGRALPEEFVLASKNNGQWYALPNTLGTSISTVTPISITVDNTTTPTAVLYAPAETIYKGTARHRPGNNMASIRLTSNGNNYLETGTDATGVKLNTVANPGESTENKEVWHLKSSDFGAYEIKLDPSQETTRKLGIYNNKMGLYPDPTGSSEDIYILPANISYFIGGTSGHEDEWDQTDNWEGGSLPATSSIVRVLAPLKIATGEKWHVAEVDIVSGGTTSHYKSGASACEGSVEIAAGGELITTGTVKKCADAEKFASLSATEERDIVIHSNSSNGLGALVMGTHDGTNKATVNFYSLSGGTKGSSASVNQFVGTPFNDENNILYNWYNSWVYGIEYTSNVIGVKRINAGDGMEPFKGYIVISADGPGHTYWQQGTLVTSADQTIEGLNWQSGTGSNPNNENLLANSWMAPIKIAAMESTDFVKTDATIYIFNAGSKDDGDGSKTDGSPGNYSAYTIGTADDADVIPAMQSFSVYTNASGGSSVTLDYSKIVYDPALDGVTPVANRAPRKARVTADQANKLRLFVKAESGYGDMLYMWEHTDFAEGFENGWDGRKVFGENVPQLYAVTPDGNMAVNCVPDYEGVVMGFRAGASDQVYTFTFECDDEAEALYLYDTDMQAYTRVMNENSYTFTTTDKIAHNRFILTHNMPQTPTGVENGELLNGANGVHKVLINDHMYIFRGGKMYSVDGVLVK